MPNVGFNLDKFMRRIERQRVAEPGDVELLAELLTEARARIRALEADLTAALALVEAGRQERERLLSACHLTLAIAENRALGTWDDVMRLMRAALAPEEPPDEDK